MCIKYLHMKKTWYVILPDSLVKMLYYSIFLRVYFKLNIFKF